MISWKRTIPARVVMGVRLLWRTMLLQLVLALLAAAVMGGAVALTGLSAGHLLLEGSLLALAAPAIGTLLTLLTQMVLGAALFAGLWLALRGPGQVAVGEALRIGWRRWPVAANSALLLTLMVGGLLALLGALAAMLHPVVLLGLLPLVWVLLRLATVPVAAVVEDCSPLSVLRSSWRRSAGFCWSIIGSGLLLVLLTILLDLLLFILIGGAGRAALPATLAGGTPNPMGLMMMVAGTMGMAILLIVLIHLQAMVWMAALLVLFHAEQRAGAEGGGDATQQVPPASPRSQQIIAWGWVVLLSAAPVLAFLIVGPQAGGMVTTRVTPPAPHPPLNRHAPRIHHYARPPTAKRPPMPTEKAQKAALFRALRRGELQRASQLLAPLLRRHPDDPWLLQAEGWRLYRSGRKAEAAAVMARACRRGATEACLLTRPEARP